MTAGRIRQGRRSKSTARIFDLHLSHALIRMHAGGEIKPAHREFCVYHDCAVIIAD